MKTERKGCRGERRGHRGRTEPDAPAKSLAECEGLEGKTERGGCGEGTRRSGGRHKIQGAASRTLGDHDPGSRSGRLCGDIEGVAASGLYKVLHSRGRSRRDAQELRVVRCVALKPRCRDIGVVTFMRADRVLAYRCGSPRTAIPAAVQINGHRVGSPNGDKNLLTTVPAGFLERATSETRTPDLSFTKAPLCQLS